MWWQPELRNTSNFNVSKRIFPPLLPPLRVLLLITPSIHPLGRGIANFIDKGQDLYWTTYYWWVEFFYLKTQYPFVALNCLILARPGP